MNRIVLILVILGGFLTYGCNPFLDEEPDARAKVDNLTDIAELLVNAYPQATYHAITEVMSDNVKDLGIGVNCATAITDKEMYHWEDGTSSDYDSPFSVWTGLYAGISVANHALRELDKLEDTPEARALRGEALLCRAFGHFILVNLFAEHYDPATAETAFGVPYVTEPEDVAVKEYKRETMKLTYDYIEMDLRRGINMIDDNMYKQPKFHFTKKAAHAFATRFYTYKGTDWDKVLYHANLAIPLEFAHEMRNLAADKSLAVMEYMRQYTLPSQSAVLLSVTVATYWNDMYKTCPPRNSRYCLAPRQVNEIIGINSRYTFTGTTWDYKYDASSMVAAASMLKSYAYFKNVGLSSNSGMTYLNVPMLTVEDVALNRIEAHIMKGDTISALEDINRFVSKRARNYASDLDLTMIKMHAYFDNNPEGQLMDTWVVEPHYYSEIKDNLSTMRLLKISLLLRRMEFLQEGLRWFDIKRFHIPVTHNVEWDDEIAETTLSGYDPRRALQIPQEAQRVGVLPNPR
ncbi:RagB/SusD family nutrient uptake outer membrane protein [Odoribacter sp. OttesenSCG-928-A06]|nr:RagB/SusD family nutrient uptake outer membrane protein [Odoribacter sp. OttesenSCG-928-A06]